MSVEVQTLAAGQVVDGKYEVSRILGKGGMGAVYEATHLGTGRRVAVKVIVSAALANEPDVVARFQREARASGAIDSQHVVQVTDTGVDPASGDPYMVMEYLGGEDVMALVRRVGPVSPDLVTRVGAQACLGLQRAHEAGIVHRDIKSANLFLATRDGGEVQIKLLDFGIAKVRAEPTGGAESHHLTTTGSMLGSPLYMSPEQARSMKTLDARSDLWSLGVVLYEALTGAAPNNDKETLGDLLVSICVEPVTPVQHRAPWVEPRLAAIVERALQKDPKDRFQSAAEMHDALVALVPSLTIREEMLAPVSDDVRAHIAPALVRDTVVDPRGPGMMISGGAAGPPLGSTPAHAASNPSAQSGASPFAQSSSAPGVQVAAGVTARERGVSKKRGGSKALLALAGLPVVAVGAVLAVRASTPRTATRDPEVLAPVTLASASPSADLAPAPSATVSDPEPPRLARVEIHAPVAAKVEVDGAPAALRDGAVEITGKPGSLHKILVAHAGVTREFAVTILESGEPMPPRVELVAAPRTPAGPKPTPPAAPRVDKPTPPVKPQAPPPPAEPSIKKNF